MIDTKISLVIPTRNRVHTLKLVCPTYCAQSDVDEIVFVDDAGTADLVGFVSSLQSEYPQINFVVLRNDRCLGASASRNRGTEIARNSFILYCDDDEYLEADYAVICRDKLIRTGAAAVSGRRVYMREGETPQGALRRFGNGFRNKPPFDKLLCEIVNGAHFAQHVEVPFTNTIIVTRKSLVQQFPFDEYYVKSNYREESDYQMNLFARGEKIFMINDCHSIHLPLSSISIGPSSRKGLRYLYWAIKANRYFYGKYWEAYQRRIGMNTPMWFAHASVCFFLIYRTYIRSLLIKPARSLLSLRHRIFTVQS